MATMMSAFRTGLGIALCMAAISCGGGGTFAGSGGTTPVSGSNVADVVVDQGPTLSDGSQLGTFNILFVSVTICVPTTSNCQTIDHVQVDTGSVGLRILGSVLSSSLALPLQTDGSGNSLAECTVFADGYSWGPVALADVKIAGETASNVPVQIIGVSGYTGAPSGCSSQTPLGEEDTVELFGANGLIGIGPFAQDFPESATQANGVYYYCSSTTCTDSTAALSVQTVNPVTKFAVDNNGVIITLPSVAAAGQLTLSGTMTFGVDTQTNNVSGTQTVLNVDDNGYLSMTFNGATLPQSFLDSGSNGIYFNTSSLPTCAQSDIDTFYCPTNTVSLALTLQGLDSSGNPIAGQSTSANFNVGSAQAMFATSNSVLPALAGTFPDTQQSFDYGLPFFYGRRVAVVVAGATTTVGTGPYLAF